MCLNRWILPDKNCIISKITAVVAFGVACGVDDSTLTLCINDGPRTAIADGFTNDLCGPGTLAWGNIQCPTTTQSAGTRQWEFHQPSSLKYVSTCT